MPPPRRNQSTNANRALALRLLRRHHRLSRLEIAERAGLSEASVSRVVSGLLQERLVAEVGAAPSTGGRPAAHLRLYDGYYYSAAADIHNQETFVALGTLSGRLEATDSFPTPEQPMQVLNRVASWVREVLERRSEIRLIGVGVSARGLVNPDTGVVERGNQEIWTKIPVRVHLEEQLGVPVWVENNVRAAAYAEYHYGMSDVQDAHCLLFVKVDEGVGCSIVIDGELFYGQHKAAGEFGQMVIADTGSPLRHDRPGSVEQLASDQATCSYFRGLNGLRKLPWEESSSCVRQIAHRALAGDKAAVEAVTQSARYLGIGIANVIWFLDPDAVILDGTIFDAWSIVSPVILDQFADGREFLNFRNLMVRPSALRGQSAITGAAALPFQPLFDEGRFAERSEPALAQRPEEGAAD